MNKYYINITNHCNRRCPFCCMYSSPENNIFMNFEDFHDVLYDLTGDANTIVQLEGGEPTLHPQFALFLEYACSLKAVERVVIDTNGSTIDDVLPVITSAAARNKKMVEVKISLNDFLLRSDVHLSEIIRDVYFSTEFLDYVKVSANVRGYTEEEAQRMADLLGDNIPKSVHVLNDYGRAAGKGLPKLQIAKVYDEWACIATDGTDFGTDLEARSEYEYKLSNNKKQ